MHYKQTQHSRYYIHYMKYKHPYMHCIIIYIYNVDADLLHRLSLTDLAQRQALAFLRWTQVRTAGSLSLCQSQVTCGKGTESGILQDEEEKEEEEGGREGEREQGTLTSCPD